jgi:hypothetical protein
MPRFARLAAVCLLLLAGVYDPGAARAGDAAAARGDAEQALRDARAALRRKARSAFDTLRNATTFESEHVSYSGSLSRNAAALRTLIRDPKASQAFQALYDHGSPVSRIYALAAFWYLRPPEFEALSVKLKNQLGTQKIETLHGCIGGSESASVLLESRADAVRMPPGSSKYDVLCPVLRGGFTGDFVGGFMPVSLLEGATIKEELCKRKPPLPDYLKPR